MAGKKLSGGHRPAGAAKGKPALSEAEKIAQGMVVGGNAMGGIELFGPAIGAVIGGLEALEEESRKNPQKRP